MIWIAPNLQKCVYILQVEGKHIESPRTKSLLKLDGPKDACPLCKLNMKIKYTVSTH